MKTQSLEELARSKLDDSPVKSVADLTDFPYSTYAEFVEANVNESVLVWTRVGIKTCWKVGTLAQRIWLSAFFGVGPLLAVGLAAAGLAWHNFWFLLVIPSAAIGLLCASPFFIGGAGVLTCAVTSASLGVFDMAMRREMITSEPVFLWLCRHRYVSDVVVRKDTPNDAPGDKTVWPPPPVAKGDG